MADHAHAGAHAAHAHVFLAASHQANERRAWAVIILCSAMMVGEIVGGLLFGSIALIADGLHMSTHAGALLLAALAYTYARRHAHDPRFTFGTGKFGDLAGFASAFVLAMIALLIGYEAIARFLHPVPIRFDEAIPIAALGLAVNIASAWLLTAGGGHHHHPGHHDDHDDEDHHHAHDHHHGPDHHHHAAHHRDNNMRSAIVHVLADATVSVLVIVGLVLARWLGWLWMDPLAGAVGALVIASWSYGLVRDTGAILLDVNPSPGLAGEIRHAIEACGDSVRDLHLWRLGPGHLGAIVSIETRADRDEAYFRERLAHFPGLSHLTVEIVHARDLTLAA
jgi:cation diffusion facilitator family transporter